MVFPGRKKEAKDQAKEKAKDLAERADRSHRALGYISEVILVEAGKLQAALPEFHQEISRLESEGKVRYMVDALTKELGKQFNESRNLEQNVAQLKWEIKALESQKCEMDSNAIQNRQGSIAGVRVDRGNILQEPQGEFEKSVQTGLRWEAEKSCIEDQQALKLQHDHEMRKLTDDHKEIVRKILKDHETADSALEEKHNNECLRQQRAYDAEKRKLHENLQTNHATEMKNLQNSYEAEKERLLSGFDAEEKRMGLVIERLEGDLAAEERRLQVKITEIQGRHETEMNRLRDDHESRRNRSTAKMREIQENHESTIEQMTQAHESEKVQWHATKSKMLQDYESKKDLMQSMHDSEVALMNQKHADAGAQMSQKHASTITQIKRKHEYELAQQTALISLMEKEHASEQEKIKEDFEVRKLRLEREMADEEARLKTEFGVKKAQLERALVDEKERLQGEMERLRKDVEEFSAALLARDDFKPTPDNDIKTRFLDLVQDVDALGRLEWKVNQKDWPSQVLRRLSSNQRLLKKQILQDSIWVILHEYIFCSPFRIFGEEGQVLETQWNEECGRDSQLDNGTYTWPKPEIETERWRYVNIKECRAALRQPLPSEWDPRAKLKKGFKTSIDALRTELTSSLSEVATLDKSSIQATERMTMKAVTIWLEFGMQRCRISVVSQGSNLKSAKEKVRRAEEDNLRLVVVPGLKRFGNSKGLDLHIEQTIGGCDGEIVDISMRQ